MNGWLYFIAGFFFAVGVAAFTTLVIFLAADGMEEGPGRVIEGWRSRR